MVDVVESFNCANCGAPLKIKKGETVIVCDYCGSTNSLKANKTFVIKHSWMPNKLSREEALKRAREWMRSSMLMPPGIENSEITKAELIYIPLWVFETENKTRYSGSSLRSGEKKVSGIEEKKLFWKVLGRRQSAFPVREYKVPLTTKVPFSIEEAMDGQMLNGELDEEEAKSVARQEIAAHMKMLLEETVDRFDSCETETSFGESEFLHVPVWFLEFNYRGKPYKLLIEGTNGEVLKGEIPPSDFLGGEMKLIMGVAAALILFVACGFLALMFLR